MRTLMKHVWILLLSPSTTAPLPVSSRSLRVEWLTPASQRPSHFKICFDGESSLFTTCPPQFYIWWLLYAVAFPHQFDSYYFDALGNSRTIVIWCMSPSLSVDPTVLQGQRLHYFILLPTRGSVCKLKLILTAALGPELHFTITKFSPMTFLNAFLGMDKRVQILSWNYFILTSFLWVRNCFY